MANIKSAKKRIRQEKRRHGVNLARKTALKTVVKKVAVAISNNDDLNLVKDLMVNAEAQIARAKNKILHPNSANRKISRLSKKVAVYEAGLKKTEKKVAVKN